MNVHVRPSIAGVFGVAVIAIASGCSCVAEGTACPALVIAPSTLDLRLGGTATFAASESATWSIAEAGGGTIDAAGAYRAPLAIGTWHVVATAADGTTATATVRVGPRELGLLAGHPGGPGNVDGVGE